MNTGMFRLGTTCGDGKIQAGEDCDPGAAENVDCDIDCTAVLCGDGLRNAAAGEACDSIVDSQGCDQDCTLPVCGDGWWNAAVEDCDDGDTNAGANGCSGACKAINVCGDGVVADQLEQCDDGNTSDDDNGCSIGCKANNFCGDGIIQDQIEVCDDGNSDDGGDTCSGDCRADCPATQPTVGDACGHYNLCPYPGGIACSCDGSEWGCG